jgi:hypothetical protein
MLDTGLANRIRAKGVTVVEVDGWKARGNSSGFAPIGAVHHHTAGSSKGTTPSLNTCIYGRPDVPGPLCQVLQSREANPAEDKAYVIAAGKGNHGGQGTWTGRSGTMNSNYESEGLEVEHVGTAPVDPIRHEIAARILAAMCEAPGSPRDSSMVCQHFEYARPIGRKSDFFDLSPRNPEWVRDRVGYWIGRTAGETPTPPELGDGMFAYKWQKPNGPMLLVVCAGGKQSRVTGNDQEVRVTGADYYVGQVNDQTADWFKKTWGPITGG